MAPKGDFFPWWAKEDTRKGTPVIVTMENVNYSVVEIEGPDSAFRPVDKDRVKNAKQFTWVLILKANRAVGCLAWIGHILWALLGAIKKRLFFRRGVDMESEKAKLLFRLILGLLITVVAFLAFEVITHYYMRWPYFQQHNLHIIPQTSQIRGCLHLVYVSWLGFRADYIAPLILAFSKLCVALFLIQSLDRMILCIGCFWIKYKNIKPTINGGNPFHSPSKYTYPMVLVQIPMLLIVLAN